MIYKSYLVEKNIEILKNKVVLFYGENQGMQDNFKSTIKNKNVEVEIIRYNQDEVTNDVNSFFEKIFNLSLFEKKKIFILSNVNDKILSIIKEIEKKIDEQSIYLFSNLLDKKSKLRSYFEKSKLLAIIPCYQDNEITLKNIILTKIKNYKGLSPEIINLILENCNFDRLKLINELEKIILFFKDKEIKKRELISLLNIEIHDDFNILRDEAIRGNKNNTNKLLNKSIIEADRAPYYLALLNQRFDKLFEICEIGKNSEVEQKINEIKPPIFWKDKPMLLEQANKWNIKHLKKARNDIYKAEIKIKTSPMIDKNIIIRKLIVDICNLANAA